MTSRPIVNRWPCYFIGLLTTTLLIFCNDIYSLSCSRPHEISCLSQLEMEIYLKLFLSFTVEYKINKTRIVTVHKYKVTRVKYFLNS